MENNKIIWHEISKIGLPPEYKSGRVYWVAGEMKYENEKELEFFTDMAWFHPEEKRKEDVYIWHTHNDWYEGQQHYKITHWAEFEPPTLDRQEKQEYSLKRKVELELSALNYQWGQVEMLVELFKFKNAPKNTAFNICTIGYSTFITNGEFVINIFEALDQMEKQGYVDYNDFKPIKL